MNRRAHGVCSRARSFRAWLAVAVCASLLPVTEGVCGEAPARKIRVDSTPPGATVCAKVLDREECFGRTPLVVDAADSDSSKKFVFRKLGYKTREQYAEPTTERLSAVLEKRDLLYDAEKHADARIRNIQRRVNDRISGLIYKSQFAGQEYFDLVGQRTVYRRAEEIVMAFPVLINSPEALRRLKQAGRERSSQERYAATAKILDEIGAFELFDAVMESVSNLGLDKVAFNVLYAKSVAVLDFDQVEHINHRYIGTHYTGYGSVRQQVDTYEVYTTRQDVTVVKDKTVSIDYTYIVDMNAAGSRSFRNALDRIDVVTNDTPNNQYQKIERRIGISTPSSGSSRGH